MSSGFVRIYEKYPFFIKEDLMDIIIFRLQQKAFFANTPCRFSPFQNCIRNLNFVCSYCFFQPVTVYYLPVLSHSMR